MINKIFDKIYASFNSNTVRDSKYKVECSKEVLAEIQLSIKKMMEGSYIIVNGEAPEVSNFTCFYTPSIGTLYFESSLEEGFTVKLLEV